jgi:hypothetical protein
LEPRPSGIVEIREVRLYLLHHLHIIEIAEGVGNDEDFRLGLFQNEGDFSFLVNGDNGID